MKLSRNQALTLVHLGKLAHYGKDKGIKTYVGPAPAGILGYHRAIKALHAKGLLSLQEEGEDVDHTGKFALTDAGIRALQTLKTHPIYADSAMKDRSYASLQIPLSHDLFSLIQKWGRDFIPDENLTDDGRETQGHITLLYGIHPGQQLLVEKLVQDVGFACAYQLGEISLFDTNEDFDVVKIEILSEDLHELRKRLIDKIENTQTHPEYNPHITIAYVKKGSANKIVGKDNPFTTLTDEAREVEYSSEDGIITTLPLITEKFVAHLETVLLERRA